MASFEDLRDTYKSSRKARYAKAKANGASYSNKFNKLLYKQSNLVVKESHGRAKGTEFDDKYNLNATDIEFSLNKKGRWNIVSDLKSQMSDFEKENLDVNVYLTRNRIKNNKNNCIGVIKSKGGKINVKSTYANTDSLIANDKLDRYRKANPEKMAQKKKSGKVNDSHIVIDVDPDNEEEDDSSYLIYKVQYGAREDVLKYGSLLDYDDKDIVKSKRMTNVLGDESLYCKSKSYEFEDVDFSDDYDSQVDDVVVEDAKLVDGLEKTITLQELINEYTKPIIEKHKNKGDNKQEINKVSEESVRKLVYLTRQLSMNDARKNMMIQKSMMTNKDKIENFKTITQKFVESSISSEILKLAHGMNYCETYNSTPRIFVINMFKDVTDRLSSNNVDKSTFNVNIYDIKIWLLLKEQYEDALANNCQVKSYNVGIKTNIKCNLNILKQLSNDEFMSFSEFYAKIVDLIVDVPIGSFIKKPVTTAIYDQKPENYTQLNNLINKNECKGINELRSEFIETIQNKENTNLDNDEDEDEAKLDENKIQQNYENILNDKSCCCDLCFDENVHINNCGILKNCSHSFCDSCWKTYIDSRLENRLLSSGILLCPGCNNEIDLALIIYHASDIDKLERYIDDCVEKVLFVLSGYKWCASSMCGKAVKVDLKSSPYGIVSCDCGYQACLKCNMEPHFPAKCSQIAKYYRELKVENKNVKLDDIYKGEGKKCPKCHCFIEKIDGCNYMKCCSCKTEFCWQCCKTWTEHLNYNNGEHRCKITQNIGVVTVEFKTKKVKAKSLKESDYQDSIYHRNHRLKTNYRKFKSHIDRFVQSYKIEKDFKDETERQNHEKLNLLERCKIELIRKNEVRSFLHKLINFLKELHFVCEHSYLLLHDNSVQRLSRSTVSNVLKSIELIIWKIQYTLTESNGGNDAVNELRSLMDKGLNCLNKISNLKIE